MKKRYSIIIGVIAYLFFTLGNVPAAKVYSLTESNNLLPVKLYGIQGSIWTGRADKLILQNQTSIENLNWSINLSSLLLAKINADITANFKKQNVVGNITINALGTVKASDVRARIDAPIMQDLIQMPLGELGGHFNINIESLELKPNDLPIITASLKWKNAKLTLAETVDFGFIDLTIQTDENNQLVANISNKKAQLLINGSAKLDNTKRYTLKLNLTPEKNSSSSITQSLAMFARKQTDGSYLVNRKGSLRDLGF